MKIGELVGCELPRAGPRRAQLAIAFIFARLFLPNAAYRCPIGQSSMDHRATALFFESACNRVLENGIHDQGGAVPPSLNSDRHYWSAGDRASATRPALGRRIEASIQ